MNRIENAFNSINRRYFLPVNLIYKAKLDTPLPIGFGQTISQPSTVKRMLNWLNPHIGDKILDVGSGSGWTTALLSNIVGKNGTIYAVERIPELLDLGQLNCQNIGIKNAYFFLAQEGTYGLPNFGPYDRILVSAASNKVPHSLMKQLKDGGKIVIPINNDILEITKISDEQYKTMTHHGYIFVPLI